MTSTELVARIEEFRRQPMTRDRLETVRTIIHSMISVGAMRPGGEWEHTEANLLCWCVQLLDHATGETPPLKVFEESK